MKEKRKITCSDVCPFYRKNATYNVCFLYGRIVKDGDPCQQETKTQQQDIEIPEWIKNPPA